MRLNRVERERVADSRLKIRSVAKSLKQVDPGKVENYDGIQDCLEGADQSLLKALEELEKPEGSQN
jgi:hypothetical protein